MLTPHIKMVSLSNPSKRHTRYTVVNEENGIGKAVVRRSRVLVVCGHTVTESMKNDIAVAQRLGITATTLEGS